jgi:peptidyl-prolyl cis-trans isomerase D
MKKTRQLVWARNLVVAAVVIAFIAFFGQPSPRPIVPPVAELDGDPVSRESFEFFRAQNEGVLRQVVQENLDPQAFQDLLDRQTLNGLVQRHVISREATALGLVASEREVRSEILANPGFRRDGRFDRELFERFVVRTGFESPRVYTAEIRRDLLMQKFQRLVVSPLRISRTATLEAMRRERTEVRVRLALARPEDFEGSSELTPEELETFAVENAERIDRLYQQRIEQFIQPEEVRARHILLTGEDSATRAQALLERIGQGEDFAALAREHSDDLATKPQGGDLGFFPRGRMLPEFEEVAFALEPGETSEPVETARGMHLIRLEERRASVEKTLEEETPELARELLQEDRAREQAREAAERTAALVSEGREFEEAAEEAGLQVESPAPLRWGNPGVSGLGPAPALRAAAFALTPERPTAEEIFEIEGAFALVSLVEREEPTEEDLEADVGVTQQQLVEELRARLMDLWYRTRRDELQRAGRLRYLPLYPPQQQG